MIGGFSYSVRSDFHGGSVVLINADQLGLDRLINALENALANGASETILVDGGRQIELVSAEESCMSKEEERLLFSLSRSTMQDVLEKTRSLLGVCNGHHYLDDIKSEYDEIILSKNEYPPHH